MLDEKLLRKDPGLVAQEMKRRYTEFDVDNFNEIDARRKAFDVTLQELQGKRNTTSKKIGELVKSGIEVAEAKAQVAEALKQVDEQLVDAKAAQTAVRAELDALLLNLPNIADQEVPDGADESANTEISRWGEARQFDFEVRDHVDLGGASQQMDFDTAAKITGSRFVVLHKDLALLHRALIQMMLNTHIADHGYQEVYVPFLVNADSMLGTGQLPKFAEDSFKIRSEDGRPYYLIPTAEVPITNMVREQIVSLEDTPALGNLPLKFVCHSPCFRSEAGSYGRDTRGMIRQHQFEKVELVQLVPPADSEQAHEQLTGHAESILRLLELPYRKVILCTGDLGFSARRTYDLEVWLPGQNTFREISSCSNFGEYQARRMQARWRNPETGKPELLHTVNGSGLAIGRTLVAILENYQNEDGSINVPEALRPYIPGRDKLLT